MNFLEIICLCLIVAICFNFYISGVNWKKIIKLEKWATKSRRFIDHYFNDRGLIDKRISNCEKNYNELVECEKCGCLLFAKNAHKVSYIDSHIDIDYTTYTFLGHKEVIKHKYYCKIHKPKTRSKK